MSGMSLRARLRGVARPVLVLAFALGLALIASMLPAPAQAQAQAQAMDAASAAPAASAAGLSTEGDLPTVVPSATGTRQVLAMLRLPVAHARLDGSYGASGYDDAAGARSRARISARIAAAHGFKIVTQWPMLPLGIDCIVLSLPTGATVPDSINALQSHSEVIWAQPMNEFQAQGHTDPLYALQPAAVPWHLDDLHAVATGHQVRVALVDSGVDARHPDLAQAVEAQENFVDGQSYVNEFHGSAVAGLIAARADNGIGMVGIAPDARLLALRACWEVTAQSTMCNSLSLARALNFAIERHAEIINMSLSGPPDPLLGRLIDVALSRRQQVVAAIDAHAANGGFPAAHPGVVAVGEAPIGALPGAWTAPARDMPTTVPGGAWRLVSGSSFAAAQVSGLLAVLSQARAGSAPADAVSQLVRLPNGGIDACSSLAHATSSATPAAGKPAGCRPVLAVNALVTRP